MSRWSQYDTDEERLPEGMRRVGYDADTQVYTYQDTDGSYWEGPPGSRYGELHRVGDGEPPASNDDDALLGNDTTYSQKRDTSDSWRMFAPFLLLICVFLLGVYLLVGGRLWPLTGSGDSGLKCVKGQSVYTTVKGDSCWDIKSRFGMTLQELEAINEGVDCDDLQIGQELCVKNVPKA